MLLNASLSVFKCVGKTEMKQITIIGGGISGLTLAWLLVQKRIPELKITLCEATNRVGGWIRSERVSGFLFEEGPRSLRTHGSGRYTLSLVESLGLAGELISPPLTSRRRYIYTKGHLKRLPDSLGSILNWSPTLFKALWKDLTAQIATNPEESVSEFVSRRFGNDLLDYLFDPLISGIYAGDPAQLSVQAAFPKLVEWEKHGSLVKGMWRSLKEPYKSLSSPLIERWQKVPLWSLRQGLESLPRRLEEALREAGVEIKLNTPIVKLFPDVKGTQIITAIGERWHSDLVYAAMQPSLIPNLLEETIKTMAQPLRNLPSASVAIVNLGYKQKLLPYEGFGHLIPSVEQDPVLGIVWDSSLFPQQNSFPKETRLTVMMGGVRRPNLVNHAAHELEGIARKAVASQLGIKAAPEAVSVRIARNAIPQPVLGSRALLNQVKEQLASKAPYFIPFGAGWNGVALNECVVAAHQEADCLQERLM